MVFNTSFAVGILNDCSKESFIKLCIFKTSKDQFYSNRLCPCGDDVFCLFEYFFINKKFTGSNVIVAFIFMIK